MNTILRQLVNNPNAISLHELQTMMSDDKDAMFHDQVHKVLSGADAVDLLDVCRDVERTVLTNGNPNAKTGRHAKDYTKVFVWGDRMCGKTCVIGSLMSAADVAAGETITVDRGDKRAAMLTQCFHANQVHDKCDKFVLLPDESERAERSVNVHNVVLRQRSTALTHRSYGVSFIEVPLTLGVKGGAIAKDILDTEGEQIHLLCLDCTGDIMLQGQMFMRLLDYLDDNNYISKKTVGVFVVVTKTDTMYHVPRQYRDMAGQTLVTAKLRTLWQKVSNICYDKGIYSATPIIYSVGDVKLQYAVKLDFTTAHALWHNAILLKSQPMQSVIGKVLRWGNGTLTAAAFIAVVSLVGYSLYAVLTSDANPPDSVNKPYDYKVQFISNVNHDFEGSDYEHAKAIYTTMHDDLEQEHTIYTIDDTPVLTSQDYTSCDSALSVTFANIVNSRIDTEMSKHTWNDTLLKELLSKTRNLLTHKLTPGVNSQTNQKTALLTKYFDEVKPFLSKINNCQSLADVQEVIEKCDGYYETPFTNNTSIADTLANAKQNSIRSYSNYLKAQADYLEANNSNKSSYADAMADINASIDEFADYLNKNGYSQFVSDLNTIKQKLREVYDNLSTSWLDFFRF